MVNRAYIWFSTVGISNSRMIRIGSCWSFQGYQAVRRFDTFETGYANGERSHVVGSIAGRFGLEGLPDEAVAGVDWTKFWFYVKNAWVACLQTTSLWFHAERDWPDMTRTSLIRSWCRSHRLHSSANVDMKINQNQLLSKSRNICAKNKKISRVLVSPSSSNRHSRVSKSCC